MLITRNEINFGHVVQLCEWPPLIGQAVCGGVLGEKADVCRYGYDILCDFVNILPMFKGT